MLTYDFSSSFVTFRVDIGSQQAITLSHKPPTMVNNARIQIECICNLVQLKTGNSQTFVLGASCKTERVGAKEKLWLRPNGDFCLIASPHDFLVIKSWQQRDIRIRRFPESLGFQVERQVGPVREAWTSFRMDIKQIEGRALRSFDEIRDATFDNIALTACTEYQDGDYLVQLFYPVKTFNVSEVDGVYQTDTGPIMLPNLSHQESDTNASIVDCFELAYSAFNCPEWTEFIINCPVPLSETICVDHYARERRIENTINTLIAMPQR